jgi:hypothetical protein
VLVYLCVVVVHRMQLLFLSAPRLRPAGGEGRPGRAVEHQRRD